MHVVMRHGFEVWSLVVFASLASPVQGCNEGEFGANTAKRGVSADVGDGQDASQVDRSAADGSRDGKNGSKGKDKDKGEVDGDAGSEADEEREFMKACRDRFGEVTLAKIDGAYTIQEEDAVVALKIAGNEPHVIINAEDPESIRGICLFVTGNQPFVELLIGTRVGELVYFGRGNTGHAYVHVGESGALESVNANLAGRSHELILGGEGALQCPTGEGAVPLNGNAPTFKCQ